MFVIAGFCGHGKMILWAGINWGYTAFKDASRDDQWLVISQQPDRRDFIDESGLERV